MPKHNEELDDETIRPQFAIEMAQGNDTIESRNGDLATIPWIYCIYTYIHGLFNLRCGGADGRASPSRTSLTNLVWQD